MFKQSYIILGLKSKRDIKYILLQNMKTFINNINFPVQREGKRTSGLTALLTKNVPFLVAGIGFRALESQKRHFNNGKNSIHAPSLGAGKQERELFPASQACSTLKKGGVETVLSLSLSNKVSGGKQAAIFNGFSSEDRKFEVRSARGLKQPLYGEKKKREEYDFYKKNIKGFIGHPLKSATLLHYNSKSVVYSFNKVNNMYPLLTKTEHILKSLFLSIYSLISRPIYLLKHDKIIIRLFVFLSPRVEKYLDTSTLGQKGNLEGHSPNLFIGTRSPYHFGGEGTRVRGALRLSKFLKFKSLRPKTVEILKSQIQALCSLSLLFPLGPKRASLSEGQCKATEEQGDKNLRPTYPYTSLISNFKINFEKLGRIFSKIFNKKVEFEIIKAQLPFQDSNILAQILGYNANNYQFRRMLKILIPRAVIKNPGTALPLSSSPSDLSNLSTVHFNSGNKQVCQHALKANRPSVRVQEGEERLENLAKTWVELGEARADNFKLLLDQPSSYLPPFFYNKSIAVMALNLGLADTSRFTTSAPVQSEGRNKVSTDFKTLVLDLSQDDRFKKDGPCLAPNPEKVSAGVRGRTLSGYNQLPSYLSGMNIKLAGRLMTQSMRPRFTVQSKQEGSLARVKVHFVEKSRFTGKNKRGAFSFTVMISHVLNK